MVDPIQLASELSQLPVEQFETIVQMVRWQNSSKTGNIKVTPNTFQSASGRTYKSKPGPKPGTRRKKVQETTEAATNPTPDPTPTPITEPVAG
jgi:hypothetical protein